MITKMITITENNNTYSGKKELYNFCIVKNGNPDSIEQNIFDMIKDMNKRGYININKFNDLFKYDNSLISLSNVSLNLKNPILNLNDNLTMMKEQIFNPEKYIKDNLCKNNINSNINEV